VPEIFGGRPDATEADPDALEDTEPTRECPFVSAEAAEASAA
jgi:hypothetical protein